MKKAKVHLWLIRFVGLIVPRRLRTDWRQEWEAELQWREQQLAEWDKLNWQNKRELLWHSAGAFVDALWLQPKRWEDEMMQDFRFAFRNVRKHAWLSLVVVVTLTLGIGISTGVFAWFNAEFLRARVNQNRDSFVKIYSGYTDDPKRTVIPDRTTWQDYEAFRDTAKSFSLLAASGVFNTSLEEGDASVTRVALVTDNFFALCDVRQALLGRLLQPEDCTAAHPVIVLSEWFWRLQLAADPQVLGRVLHVNGQPVTVVGVAPNSAAMGNGARAWLPYSVEGYLKLGNNLQRPGEAAWLDVEGRLRPGFSHAQAAQEIRLLAAQQDRLHPGRISTVAVTDGSSVQ